MNILLNIRYDGTNYSGWQAQNNKRTIQGEIECALEKLFNKKVCIRGASRTDAGVHALNQIAVFEYPSNTSIIKIEKLPFAINSFLNKDIVITNAIEVFKDFHPQYNVYKKTYHYKIYNDRFINPINKNYTEFVHIPLNLENMQSACKYIIGEKDFKSFCATGGASKTTVREVYDISVKRNEDNIINIEITGNGFLYNMVRIIAGTLIEIGQGKYEPIYMKEIIEAKDRKKAGRTASAKGLTLAKIYYKL